MHAGTRVRLGDHQGAALARLEPAGIRQVLNLVPVFGGAQQPQAAAVTDAQHVLSVDGLQVVLPVAEEGEVVAVEPAQQFLRLLDLLDALGVGDVAERVGDLHGLRSHGLPVLVGGANVAEDRGQPGDQSSPRLVVGGFDLDRDPRLDLGDGLVDVTGPSAVAAVHAGDAEKLVGVPVAGHDEERVHFEVDGRVLAHQLGGHRVNQERHVVGDDVDDAAAGFVPDLDVRGAGGAALGDLPMVDGPLAEGSPIGVLPVFPGQVLVVVAQESVECAACR